MDERSSRPSPRSTVSMNEIDLTEGMRSALDDARDLLCRDLWRLLHAHSRSACLRVPLELEVRHLAKHLHEDDRYGSADGGSGHIFGPTMTG